MNPLHPDLTQTAWSDIWFHLGQATRYNTSLIYQPIDESIGEPIDKPKGPAAVLRHEGMIYQPGLK